VSTGPTACIYVATCTRPTVRHVYSDRTRGELQVAKNNFFCSVIYTHFKATDMVAWFHVSHLKQQKKKKKKKKKKKSLKTPHKSIQNKLINEREKQHK
jgi:hypothetical protein